MSTCFVCGGGETDEGTPSGFAEAPVSEACRAIVSTYLLLLLRNYRRMKPSWRPGPASFTTLRVTARPWTPSRGGHLPPAYARLARAFAAVDVELAPATELAPADALASLAVSYTVAGFRFHTPAHYRACRQQDKAARGVIYRRLANKHPPLSRTQYSAPILETPVWQH
jgi:hypothetical protein